MPMKCPICGAAQHACGPPNTGTPVSLSNLTAKGANVSDLREYTVTLNGSETTMMLDPAEAEAMGGVEVNPAKGKAKTPEPAPVAKSAAPSANKARTPRDKRA